ncbi:MAG: hypothetical protein GWP91_00475 [Rhodobacterales bacterium]|nr:hypothetical protein [Rhodobacterales bacterium]
MWRTLALFLLIACSGKNAKPEAEPVVEVASAAEPAPEPAAVPIDAKTEIPSPQELYDSCEERVEGRQKEGECTVDADCKAAGCGSEVCTTVANAAEVMTTCEGKICFKILDTCGCHEGMCTWTIKDTLPELGAVQPATKLPTKLPSKPPAGGVPPADGAE